MVDYVALANDLWVVLAAYVAVFVPWTAVTTTDFISSKWKTVGNTRRAGYFQLFFILIPAAYLTFYIFLQATAADYKEMSAAIVGLVFAFLHLVRTLWGLWQLVAFRKWAAASIFSLRRLGYEYELKLPQAVSHRLANAPEDLAWNSLDLNLIFELNQLETLLFLVFPKQFSLEHLHCRIRKDPYHLADYILVNDSLVDNQVMGGETRCYLQVAQFSPFFLKVLGSCKRVLRFPAMFIFNMYVLVAYTIWYLLQLLLLLPVFFVCFCVALFVSYQVLGLMSPLWSLFFPFSFLLANGGSFVPKFPSIGQVPYSPVKVWINWSAAFTAQGLLKWVQHVAEAQDAGESSEEYFFGNERDHFAGEVLASAALHFAPGWREAGAVNSPFLWSDLGKESADSLSDGRMTKRDLLLRAAENGEGLPFEVAHSEIKSPKKGMKKVLYGAYEGMLAEVTNNLSAQYGEDILKFDIGKLEWLAIILSLGSRNIPSSSLLLNYISELFVIHRDAYRIRARSLEEGESTRPLTPEESSNIFIGLKNIVRNQFEQQMEIIRHHLEMIQDYLTDDSASSDHADSASSDHADSAVDFSGFSTAESTESPELCHELSDGDVSYDSLQIQLGYEFIPDNSLHPDARNVESRSAFPMDRRKFSGLTPNNPSVLRIGLLIDIWLALVSGEQVLDILEKDREWETLCIGDRNDMISISGYEMNRTNPRLRRIQWDLEEVRLMNQLSIGNQRYRHMDQTLTFMGYTIEFVRASLGHWVKLTRNGNPEVDAGEDISRWSPEIAVCSMDSFDVQREVKTGSISVELSQALKMVKTQDFFERRAVQVRVILELQELLQDHVRSETNADDRGPSLDALIMLFLLGFPSIEVKQSTYSDNEDNPTVEQAPDYCGIFWRDDDNTEKLEVKKVKLTIMPVCGPQKLVVHLRFEQDDENWCFCCCLGNKDGAGVAKFRWEWWRDAFSARLEGISQWQMAHGMPTTKVCSTDGPISQGVREIRTMDVHPSEAWLGCLPFHPRTILRTWDGWKPFRLEMCQFELESSLLVFQNISSSLQEFQFNNPSTGEPWSISMPREHMVDFDYEAATRDELKRASLFVQEAFSQQEMNNGQMTMKGKEARMIGTALRIIRKSPRNASRATFLLEMAAVFLKSPRALEHLFRLLVDGEHTNRDVLRAIALVDICLGAWLESNACDAVGNLDPKKVSEACSRFQKVYAEISKLPEFPIVACKSIGWWFMTVTGERMTDPDRLKIQLRKEYLLSRRHVYIRILNHVMQYVITNDTIDSLGTDGERNPISQTEVDMRKRRTEYNFQKSCIEGIYLEEENLGQEAVGHEDVEADNVDSDEVDVFDPSEKFGFRKISTTRSEQSYDTGLVRG